MFNLLYPSIRLSSSMSIPWTLDTVRCFQVFVGCERPFFNINMFLSSAFSELSG